MTDVPSNGNSAGALPKSLFGYDVVEFLGEGAGSLIYAVTDPVTHQIYALKHVVVKTEKQARFAEQLLNEFEAGKNIHDPLIRRIIDAKVNKTLLRKITEAALIMELVDGTALDALPQQTIPRTMAIFGQVAKGLAVLHSGGVIHCDLKPNNILVCSDDSIKLIDLGQACPAMTVKQRIQGTPDFISPEQVKCEPVTAQTDIFNFGATLYWALCGKKLPTLFTLKKGDNSLLFDQMIPAPHEENPKVPVPLSNLVMECVRTNPAKRPADATELARRLDIMAISMNRNAAAQPAAS